MKIYAVKDRLIDYFLQPFAGPDDKNVLAAVSQQINSGDTHAISQAPQHFEVWRLGEVDQEGNLIARKEFIADCASLVRPGIRGAASAQRGGAEAPQPDNSLQGQDQGTRGANSAHKPPPARSIPASPYAPAEIP